MLAVTGIVALLVYDFVGLGFLRRGWINLDLIWAAALIAMGVFAAPDLIEAPAGRIERLFTRLHAF